jgi:hypothetical protein
MGGLSNDAFANDVGIDVCAAVFTDVANAYHCIFELGMLKSVLKEHVRPTSAAGRVDLVF